MKAYDKVDIIGGVGNNRPEGIVAFAAPAALDIASAGLRQAGRFVAVLATTFCVALAAMPTGVGPAGAQEAAGAVQRREPSLTVTGRGEVTAVPDVLRVSIGVSTEAKAAADALAENSKAVAALVFEAETAGIPRRKIATSRLTIRPVVAQKKVGTRDVPEVVGYVVVNALSLEISPVDRAGGLIDRLVARGANTVDGLALEVSDAERRRDEARKLAVVAARAKAELFATAAKVRLGRVLDLREASVAAPARSYAYSSRAAAAPPPPIEAGETTIAAEVTVTFELLEGAAN